MNPRALMMLTALALLPVAFSACCLQHSNRTTNKDDKSSAQPSTETTPSMTPMDALKAHIAALAAKTEHKDAAVEVQHLLVGFRKEDGSTTIPGKPIKRTKAEAESLVADLLAKITAGGNFDALVSTYTEDSAPGIYGMVLRDTGANPPGYYPRNGMVPAFGNVGWKLAVGEVGVAEYNPTQSPYGWHIVKRLK